MGNDCHVYGLGAGRGGVELGLVRVVSHAVLNAFLPCFFFLRCFLPSHPFCPVHERGIDFTARGRESELTKLTKNNLLLCK